MCEYIISCCSAADLTSEHLTKRKVVYIPFHFILGGKEFSDDLGRSLPYSEFYQAMRDGADTKTTQINVEEYYDYFKGLLTSGKSILHVSLSSGLSGTVNSARIAARDLEKEFPDQKIYVVDSLAASGGYGLLVDKLCDLRDEGKSIEEVYDWANENKKKLHHWFYSGDLTFYVRGGRVSKVSGFVGTLLKICPLLNVDYCGKLIPREKILGRRNAQKALVDKMLKFAQGGTDYNQKCFITHSDAPDEAMAVKAMVEKCFPHLDGEVNVSSIGSTIGSHSGPGTVAIYFWGTERVD